MKKSIGKKELTATIMSFACFLSVNYSNIAFAELAPRTTVAVNVQIQQNLKSGIDWTKGADSDMTVIGIGLPPQNAGSSSTTLARRAAIVDAYRNLAELIEGVQVDAETVMKDFMVQNDSVRTQVNALIKGARIVEEGSGSDGRYFVKMSIPLYGTKDSLAAIAIPNIRSTVVEPLPTADTDRLSRKDVQALKKNSYTGIIVDAHGLGLESTFSPVIFDISGRAVYGIKNIDPDFAISQGMVEYATSIESALLKSRAGTKPLVIKAISVQGGRNSANKVNVTVSLEDADRILVANESSGMLQKCAVVFVK
jgi:hypothetical protein